MPLFRKTTLCAALILLGLALVVCGPAHPQSAASPPAAPSTDHDPTAHTAPESGPGLSAETFYRILVGDVALQRGDPGLAARAYLRGGA